MLLRLGELIAYAEGAAALRPARGRGRRRGSCPRRPTAGSTPTALAALSRVFAREAALKVAERGPALGGRRRRRAATLGRAASPRLGARPRSQRAQAGLLADMDAVADALYDRADALMHRATTEE